METIVLNNWADSVPKNYTGIVEDRNGSIFYFLNGKYHREDGPAIIYSDGALGYYLNGKRHREDGPAIIYSFGLEYYYLKGNNITEKVNKWIKENNIPDYKFWNESDKRLFRITFNSMSIECERSVEQKMKTIKLDKCKDAPKNYTGVAECSNGSIFYFLNGKFHREDGPAITHPFGSVDYYLNDKNITEKVNRWIKNNNIPDYKFWNESDKRLFRETFCYNVTKLERSVEQKSTEEKMKTIKVDNFYDLPENYTGIVKYHGGSIEYYLNGEFHREDGPAIIWDDGTIQYYLNGKCHREDGPAAIQPDGSIFYYLNDKNITEKVNKWIKNNNIPDYKFWNEVDKKLFRKTFNSMTVECERSTEEKMKTLKLNSPNDLPKNYTGIVEYPSGNIFYYLNGKLHRKDGPTVIRKDGSIEYYLNDLRHREDGPAIIDSNGIIKYYLNGKLHREDGPAFIDSDGTIKYYLNGFFHREDGPAIIRKDGSLEYYLNGLPYRGKWPSKNISRWYNRILSFKW